MKCIQQKNIKLHPKPQVNDAQSVAPVLSSELQRLTSFQSYPATYAAGTTTTAPTKDRNKTQQILR